MKEKLSRHSTKKGMNNKEKEEEILYEKLIIMGDKNVGKLSLIQNIFSQDNTNIITPDNNKENNINKEIINSDINDKTNENNNQKKEEEKKESIKKKEEKEKNQENNNNSNKEKKEEGIINNDTNIEKDKNNHDDIKKEVDVIIYEKKISMKNGVTKMKDFQLLVTSLCDNSLIHSLSFMCQCILILFDIKNKLSFENAKKIINIMDSELNNKKYKIILVSTKNDQDSQNKEQENKFITNEEINNFINEIKEKNSNNKYGIIISKYMEISNNTKRGINNLRAEILNSYEKDLVLHKPLKLGYNSDFTRLKSDDIYDKFNSTSTNHKSTNNANIINRRDYIIETIPPKYLFKLKNSEKNKNLISIEDNIYENIKIILLGDTNVGKTSFLSRFFSEGFNPNLTSTIGITERSKILCYENKIFKIKLWDTAGQERFESIPKQYYERIEGVFLFYDITNEQSFDNIVKWLKDILEGGHKDLIVYLLGNKVDLIEKRKISHEKGLSFAKSKNIKFMEISCKLDLNITDVVYFMIYDILKIENYCCSDRINSFSINKLSINSHQDNKSTTNKNRYSNGSNNNSDGNWCCF